MMMQLTAPMRHSGLARTAPTPAGTHFRPLIASHSLSRQRHITRAGFDEGAAQVRRLLDRDRKDLDLDELENAFADNSSTNIIGRDQDTPTPKQAAAAAAVAAAAAASTSNNSNSDSTTISPSSSPPSTPAPKAASPFSPSSSASPFSSLSSPSSLKKPFGEPAGLSPTMQPDVIKEQPWWRQVTKTQIVIVLSFTTIISLMVATFFFVLKVGAVRLNVE